MKLTVIVPAYNEAATIAEVIRRVLATGVAEEIVVVDDGSTDGTAEILSHMPIAPGPVVCVLRHAQNRGKGAAIRTGLAVVTGDLVLVQDADLEYEPAEYSVLLAPFSDPAVQVVYGSRNLQHNPRSNFAFYWGGRFLSWVANRLYGSRITDEATGYKVVRTSLLRELNLQSEGFEFCAEVTAKLLRRGVRIREVPISYRPRFRAQGKKIQWYDGIVAVWTLVRYRFFRARPGAGQESPPRG
jgi:glycosyltransferase involved in cell wall biosynthesis